MDKAVINNTSKTLAEIQKMPVVGKIKNNWRERDVTLYQDYDAGILGMLYMVGVSFSKTLTVVSYEPEGLNETVAMDYWRNGQKVLTRD